MKPFLSLTLALALCVVARAEQTSSPASSDEDTIRKIEQEWAEALVKRDQATIDRCESPDWTLTDPEGALMTKAQADADLKNGVIAFESYHLDDLKVRVYGDTAVVFGLETEKSKYKGQDTSGQYRFTDVLLKRDGRWLAVATHVTKVQHK